MGRKKFSREDRELRLDYDRIEDAPVDHRHAARLAAAGFSPAEIARLTRHSTCYIDALLQQDVVRQHIEAMQIQGRILNYLRDDQLGELIDQGLDEARKALTDARTSTLTKLKILEFACDRHHDAKLTKHATHTPPNGRETVAATANLQALRERALRLGRVAEAPDPAADEGG